MPKVALVAFASMALVSAGNAPMPSPAGATTYRIVLTGREEVASAAGTSGDMDGAGVAKLVVAADRRQICYDFKLSGLSTPLMAHIHRGHARSTGPTVVTLFTGPGGDLENCLAWTPNKLSEIVSDPSNFYVNLSTTEFPDGALRGQLQS